MKWTDIEVARLKLFVYGKQHTYSEIAKVLARSRRSVEG